MKLLEAVDVAGGETYSDNMKKLIEAQQNLEAYLVRRVSLNLAFTALPASGLPKALLLS